MPKSPIELTEAEWTVIKAVWDSEPCDAPAIREKLFKKTGWTYSTVRTLMDRMTAKKLLTAEKFDHLAVRVLRNDHRFLDLRIRFRGQLGMRNRVEVT